MKANPLTISASEQTPQQPDPLANQEWCVCVEVCGRHSVCRCVCVQQSEGWPRKPEEEEKSLNSEEEPQARKIKA